MYSIDLKQVIKLKPKSNALWYGYDKASRFLLKSIPILGFELKSLNFKLGSYADRLLNFPLEMNT